LEPPPDFLQGLGLEFAFVVGPSLSLGQACRWSIVGYLAKGIELLSKEPSGRKNSLGLIIAGAAGGAVAIGLMEELSTRAAFPLIFVPFATSIVLIMGSPATEAAQPRALIGGHLLATLVGLLVVKITGRGPLAAAFAVGLAMVAMHLTRSFHPPAGIDPLVIVVNDMSWGFLPAPVAIGVCLLAAMAFVWHNLVRRHSWPERWW
jgi:CBS-domain-containing membrane protein